MKFESNTQIGSLRWRLPGYIWDHLFYRFWKPLWEAICAKFDNPLNNYMTLMWAARKAEGEHEQEKHNTSYASKAGMVSEASTDQARPDDQDIKAPMQEPWSKWVEMQQQLMAAVKGALSTLKKTQWQSSTRGQRRNSQNTSANDPSSQWQGNSHNSGAARSNQTQTRGGNDRNQIQCYNCQGWGHMHNECLSAQSVRPLNSQRGRCNRTSQIPGLGTEPATVQALSSSQ